MIMYNFTYITYILNSIEFSCKQWQPQPVGHTVSLANHAAKCSICPPWPQNMQKLLAPRFSNENDSVLFSLTRPHKIFITCCNWYEPLTVTWHTIHWKLNALQLAHCGPWLILLQSRHSFCNSTPFCTSNGDALKCFNTCARPSNSSHLCNASAYDFL